MSKSSAMGLAALLGTKDSLGFALLSDISRMKDVEIFEDPLIGVWESLPTAPVSMQEAVCIADGTKIYLFPSGDSVRIYDTVLGTWSSGLADSVSRSYPCGTKIGREIFIFESGLRIYNMDTNTWGGGAPPTWSVANGSAVTINGKAYLAYSASTPTDYYEYNPASSSYTRKTGAGVTMAYSCSLVFDDKMYVFGAGNQSQVIIIDPATDEKRRLYVGALAVYGYAASYKDIGLLTGSNQLPAGTMNALFDSRNDSFIQLPDRVGGSYSPCCAFVDDVCYVFDQSLVYKIKIGSFIAPFDGVAFSPVRASFPITKGLTYAMGASPIMAISV